MSSNKHFNVVLFRFYGGVFCNSLIHFVVSVQKLSLLADLGQTPDYMLKPPKEVLVEKASIAVLLTLCITNDFSQDS